MPKCADCGFLSLRNKLTGQLDGADAYFRRVGKPSLQEIPVVGGMGNKFALVEVVPFEETPICFAQSVNLADNWPDPAGDQQDWADTVLAVVTKERPECANEDGFTPWQQGFTPKEHREMLDRERMIKWQEGREAADHKWREDQRKIDNRWHIRELGVIVLGIIAAALITLFAAFIERGGSGVEVSLPPGVVVSDTTLNPPPSPESAPDTEGTQPPPGP